MYSWAELLRYDSISQSFWNFDAIDPAFVQVRIKQIREMLEFLTRLTNDKAIPLSKHRILSVNDCFNK